MKLNFRLEHLLLFLKPLYQNTDNKNLIKIFLNKTPTNSLFCDVFYHKSTIKFLQAVNIYTLGIVPLNMSASTVDVAIPVNGDNIFIQTFFLKLTFSIQNLAQLNSYLESRNIWFLYKLGCYKI